MGWPVQFLGANSLQDAQMMNDIYETMENYLVSCRLTKNNLLYLQTNVGDECYTAAITPKQYEVTTTKYRVRVAYFYSDTHLIVSIDEWELGVKIDAEEHFAGYQVFSKLGWRNPGERTLGIAVPPEKLMEVLLIIDKWV
jgi:hypothetical protein